MFWSWEFNGVLRRGGGTLGPEEAKGVAKGGLIAAEENEEER
jgi:hypothetical protein